MACTAVPRQPCRTSFARSHALHANDGWFKRALMVLAVGVGALVGNARAADHALVMWIGQYPEASARLHGAPVDGRLAQEFMVRALRVPAGQMVVLAERQLTLANLQAAFDHLRLRVRAGDRVFVYFSGHGQRRARTTGAGCREGIMTADGSLYFEELFRAALEELAVQPGVQVVMFNDSCYSGGIGPGGGPTRPAVQAAAQAKRYPLPDTGAAGSAADARCAAVSNAKGGLTPRSYGADDRLLYLSAAGEDEAAWSTAEGSHATRAWHACLLQPRRGDDTDGDGWLNGHELARCAQNWLNTWMPQERQTLGAQYNSHLRLLKLPP